MGQPQGENDGCDALTSSPEKIQNIAEQPPPAPPASNALTPWRPQSNGQELAKQYGKYGNEVGELVSRTKARVGRD